MSALSLSELLTVGLVGAHALLWLTLLGNLIYLRSHDKGELLDQLPSVSVLIPARNEARNLRRLLPSLLNQDYASFEVIVYDDASEDDTWPMLQSVKDERLHTVRGEGPPPGWLGKVHALYQATRPASGERYLFLDADAELHDAGALRRLAERFERLPSNAVLTGLTRLRGAGLLLVSLVPYTILTSLPWPLVRRVSAPSLGALNGQCWMIGAAAYHRLEPHEHVAGEVLEDVQIGRYLKRHGLTPALVDVQQEVSVHMYPSFRAAWRGFRKNAYLIMGGAPLPFALSFTYFALTYLLAPFVWLPLLGSIYGLKLIIDRRMGFPGWVSALAPASYLLGSALQLDSAFHHLRGRVSWKSRSVGTNP